MINSHKQEDQKIMKSLGEHIRKFRKARGMSQHDLALEADVSRTQISRMENGSVNTSVGSLLRVAKALRLTKNQLLDLLAFESLPENH